MKHTAAILQKDKTLLEVVNYEFEMLAYTLEKGKLEMKKEKTKKNLSEISICLESFLLHARNLIDFLEANGQKDDILITDFKNVCGEKLMPLKLGLEKDLKKKINKHCQHLSKSRLSKKYKWKLQKVYNKIASKMKKFRSQI